MANGVGFEHYPLGPSPDPRAVGAMLAQKSAAHAAGVDDYDELGGGAGGGADADSLDGARLAAGRASDLAGRGTPSLGPLTATGGDGTGSPGRTPPPPPVGGMPSQAASNPVTRPPLATSDNDYLPGVESSSSATAAALDDATSRTTGGASGIGKVQNASMGSPLQRAQLLKMGLSPVEVELLAKGGGGVKL